jgi:hypothetical protein
MTGARKEPAAAPPAYELAAGMLLAAAKLSWDAYLLSGRRKHLQAWQDLRLFAVTLLERESMCLAPSELIELRLLLSGCAQTEAVLFLLAQPFDER